MLLLKKTYEEWAALSGLTPVAQYSLADHALAALKIMHPDAPAGFSSLNDFMSLGVYSWVEVGRNHVTNPCNGVSTSKLNSNGLSVSTVTGAARLTLTSAGTSPWLLRAGQVSGNGLPATPGQVWSFRVEVGNSTQVHDFRLRCWFQDSSNIQVGAVFQSSSVSVTSSGFEELTVSGTVPADASKIGWEVGVYDTGARTIGDTFDVRKVMAAPVSLVDLPATFDGNTPDTPTDRYEWAGAEGLSESIHYQLIG